MIFKGFIVDCQLKNPQRKGSALKAKKDISVAAIEVQLNFLVSKLLGGDKQASREFYNELIEIIEKSSMNNKDELIAYLKERYTAF